MKRFLWIFLPTLFFISILAVGWHYGEKQLSQFLIAKGQSTLKQSIQWNLEVGTLQLHLAPPGIEIKEVHLTPSVATAQWLKPIHIKEIVANLDFLNLLAGQIKLAFVRLNRIDTGLSMDQIPPSEKPLERLPIHAIFDILQMLPIKLVLIENTELLLTPKTGEAAVPLRGNFLFQSAPQSIFYRVKIEANRIHETASPNEWLRLQSTGILSPKTLQLSTFDLNTPNSKMGLQGEFANFPMAVQTPLFSGLTDFNLDLQDLTLWLKRFKILSSNDIWHGQVQSQGSIAIPHWEDIKVDWKTTFSKLAIGSFQLGNITSQIKYEQQQLLIPELLFHHPSGALTVKDFLWHSKSDAVNLHLDLKSLDLQKLFQELHLQKIPVDLLVTGGFKCQGRLLHNSELKCDGKVGGQGLSVRPDMHSSAPPIVHLAQFSGAGTVTINKQEVTYDSTIVLPHSSGRTKGVINYETGFVIDFDTDHLVFEDLNLLSGLRLEGNGKLKGRTQGNATTATLDIDLSTNDFWFENFGLGAITGTVSYKKGHLMINSSEARLFNSAYLAQVDVDLLQSRIKGLVEIHDLRVEDAMKALSHRVEIPFAMSGRGRTRAQFEGPLRLGGLSYRFGGILQKGDIEGEPYDEIKWDWVAKDGNVLIENNTLQKGKALITVNGKAIPTGHVALEIDAQNFKLENSVFLSKYVKTLGGDVSLHVSINNHILRPNIFLEGKIERTTLGDAELPDSKFIFETDSNGKSVSLDLLGHQIKMDLDLPYNENDSAQLFLEVQKMDFTDILALLMGSPLRKDYRSLMTMRMDIQSQTNNIFNSSGMLRIDDFYLARGEHSLRNAKPMIVHFEEGYATLKDFSVRGHQSEITATGESFSPSKLKINLGGTLDLRLIQLFTPFLEDVSGPVRGQIRIGGNVDSPEVYGNVDFNDVAVRLKGFSPLFDHINSHLEFSQKRIIIESVRGSLAGGSLMGDGSITINGVHDVRVDVKTQLKNLQMEVPAHFQSSGSAELVFSGNSFPYTLSGTYRITQAFIDKDFTADAPESNIRQSIYLPKNMENTTADPVILDLQIFLDRKVEIKNPQISGFLSGQLQVKGPPQAPVLFGAVKTLPQAQLFFRDKIFDIQSGLVKFSDPSEINPELYFTARSLVDKYEINLLLQGKAKNPQLNLTSQPPLEEPDIISLLALGVTTQKLDSQIQSSQQAAQTGYQLGSAIISANPLNKEIKQSLGLDVKFSSAFDDTKNVALPRVTVSTDLIPRKLNASASSSFSENQQYDVRFQYLLNDRLSTVVTYEKSDSQNGTTATGTDPSNSSIFGLDLEYKVEFK